MQYPPFDSLSVKSRRWHALLLNSEPSVLDRSDDGFRQWLHVLLLHHGLDILSVRLCR